MKSTFEPLDDTSEATPPRRLVKVSVSIDESEFDRDVDRAFRKLANEVRLPGFRQGKVPRKVLEARIGLGPARDQALRDAVPQYLAAAVREHELDLIATPEVTITGGAEAGDVTLDATCEIRPEITVPGYGGLRVELPAPEATDEEIDEAIRGDLRRHASLVDVDRPVQSGDQVTLDLSATRDGEPVIGLTTEDWLYEVGRGWVAPGFDNELLGAAVGAELRFVATPNGTEEPADFVVVVKSVQETVLPELDDEFVDQNIADASTVDEYRAAVAERLGASKLNQARNVFVDRLTTALAELVDVDAPASMVESDLQARVQNTVQQFQAQGIPLEQWLQVTGQSAEQFLESLRVQSEKAVKVDLALRAVATAEAIEVSDDDLEREYARIAMQVRDTAKRVRQVYEKNDAVTDLIAQIRKNKALDVLVRSAEIVDPTGAPIERSVILGETADHDDHDHDDHDHDHDHDH